MTDAVEQRHLDLILQLLDRLADRRLGREDDFGGPGELALANIPYQNRYKSINSWRGY
jgi:hypothetical protein